MIRETIRQIVCDSIDDNITKTHKLIFVSTDRYERVVTELSKIFALNLKASDKVYNTVFVTLSVDLFTNLIEEAIYNKKTQIDILYL